MGAIVPSGNPLREGLLELRKPDTSVLVIFGGSGDLARRKLMPSLYELALSGRLPDSFTVVGFAHSKRTHEEYRDHVHQALTEFTPGTVDDSAWKEFAQRLYYVSSDFQTDSGYEELKSLLNRLCTERQTGGNEIFYLATPPSFFPTIIQELDKHSLSKPEGSRVGWKRIVIEKPFGRDLESARSLNRLVAGIFDESDIYRVDHYLGKETVQNTLVLRFANSIFEPVWNRRYVDHVQITATETVGVEGRGDYYEEAGALRDMVQSHCLQMLGLVAMEPPVTFGAEDIRDEKAKIFRAIRRITPPEVERFAVRGQYGPGLLDGHQVPGYREEEDVSPESTTETFVAAKFYIDNWRWQEVPFYVRTGKRLPRKLTEIAVQFKPVPHGFFDQIPSEQLSSNVLVIRIQPDEGISLRMETKLPGTAVRPRPVELDFRYLSTFGMTPTEAYEKLILDCMHGDQTLFARRDAVEEQWTVLTPILQGWASLPPPNFPNYSAGGWQPEAVDDLIQRDGRRWRTI